VGIGAFLVLSYSWFVAPAAATVESLEGGDAVVVFAGNRHRVETAVELMERGFAMNLVIPNGHSHDVYDARLCDRDDLSFDVFCPETATDDTRGEAQAIGLLAEDKGWSRLIAVTSTYHIHRATLQLGHCHDGHLSAVASEEHDSHEAWPDQIVHEWAGTLAAMTFDRAC
jgi:uncharacterized SAM-binding protein YcdF (DUF218 family)